MIDTLGTWFAIPWVEAATIALGSVLVAYLVSFIVLRAVSAVVAKTKTDIDDQIFAVLRRPLVYTVVLAGLALATAVLARARTEGWFLPAGAKFVIYGLLKTLAVVVWTVVAIRVAAIVLGALSGRGGDTGVVQVRTLPAFDIMSKVVAIAAGSYFVLVAWNVNVSGWLASAGVLGIMIGLAAKDTLANLFAGIFILADAPYKLGDFIQLDDNLRGKVTDIGIRSTRILTRSDIEITIPNALIGNSKIINETAGRHPKERVTIEVFAAYGADVDQVREVLLGCAEGVEHVCPDPEPRVRFRQFGDSGLRFELLAWIEEPVLRGRVIDALNNKVYKAFNAAGLEIPFSKHDVYIKEQPGDGELAA